MKRVAAYGLMLDLVPGDLFERDGELVLVGHVNDLGGECDDCVNHDFGGDDRDPETCDYLVNEGWVFLRNVLEPAT